MSIKRRTTSSMFLAFAASLFATTHASAQMPSLMGTVFHDANLDGVNGSGEGLLGVTVELYADNGDNIFDPSTDTMLDTDVTDSDGLYSFYGLDSRSGYFVQQTSQLIEGTLVPASVTDLLLGGPYTTLIDGFDDQQRVEANPVQSYQATNLTTDSAIGGQRDLHVEYLSGPAEAVLYANPYGMAEVLEFNQSAGVQAIATVTWDGIDGDMSTTPAAGGLGGIDLTEGGGDMFSFDLGIDAAGAGEMLTMKIFSGTDVSTAVIPLPVTNGTATIAQLIPFADFVGTADFTSVDAIQMQLGGNNPSIDAQLGSIGITTSSSGNIAVATPEPSACLMILFGIVWMVGSRRKRHR